MDPDKDVLSPLELLMARKHGDITPEEYDRQKNLRNSAGIERMLGGQLLAHLPIET